MTSAAFSKRRVIICDDHPHSRTALTTECERLGCTVIGEAGRGADAIDLVVTRQPDLLILDQMLPDMNGPAVLRAIREQNTATRVLVFTGFTNSGQFYEWINQPDGPDGVLDKTSSMYELRSAILHLLTADTKYIPESIRNRELGNGNNPLSRLGPRELDVLRAVADGLRLPAVARKYHLQPHTVRSYMSSIYAKLGLPENTLQGAAAAYHQWIATGFVPPVPTGEE